MFIRPLIRFVGYNVRLLFCRIVGNADKFKELNSTEYASNLMIQDFMSALIGYLTLLGISSLVVYLFNMLSVLK